MMLDAVTLDQTRVFVAVAEAGSFRAVAGRLSRAQSAISHSIGNLEGHLGVTLFDRLAHRPTLTPEGRALLTDARAILLKVDSMRARARGLGEGVDLGLAIALDPQFSLGLAAAALSKICMRPIRASAWSCGRPRWDCDRRTSRRPVHLGNYRSRDPGPTARAGSAVVRATRCDRGCHPPSCSALQEWGAAYRGRTGGPCPDCGAGPISSDWGGAISACCLPERGA
jgi:Bacterial regulatory helix-turn-helix protein, lysR family